MSRTTLPTDSNDRKNYALFRGCLRYFPAALAGVSKTSKLGNDKHNPGEEMHHARTKSSDHADCILRHLMDFDDLLAAKKRGEEVSEDIILAEISSLAWRALALSQETHEQFGYPLAPGAKVNKPDQFEKGKQDTKDALNKKIEELIPIGQKIYEKPTAQFTIGDIVKHINNDVQVEVQGTYWDEKENEILFVKDSDNKIFGVDPKFYKTIYKE